MSENQYTGALFDILTTEQRRTLYMEMQEMSLRRFHNLLRILMNIDIDEFVAAGLHQDQYVWFAPDPHKWFIKARDEDAKKLWVLVCEREVNK